MPPIYLKKRLVAIISLNENYAKNCNLRNFGIYGVRVV
jgi:hypothetical protein